MDITIQPHKLKGTVNIIPSKSQAHRYLICAAFADKPTTIFCPETNQDIIATASCLESIGARITRIDSGFVVNPIQLVPEECEIDCGESGSTLRFLLPVFGALGIRTTIHMHGRLPERPLSPLWEEMERMGCQLSRLPNGSIQCRGRLSAGQYCISGTVSSQFVSGLLFAMSILDGESTLKITDRLESAPYVHMTTRALRDFGINADSYHIHGRPKLNSPGDITIEGDWSNGAFFLAASGIGNDVRTENLRDDSIQGDRAVSDFIKQLDDRSTISAADTPDLIPILSVVAAAKQGATFTDIQRLRMKESDRVAAIESMLHALGIKTTSTENTLTVYPGNFTGGTVDAFNDHRIAMSAAIAATIAAGPVTILGAQSVCKSYPSFWEVYSSLGGKYEQYIR